MLIQRLQFQSKNPQKGRVKHATQDTEGGGQRWYVVGGVVHAAALTAVMSAPASVRDSKKGQRGLAEERRAPRQIYAPRKWVKRHRVKKLKGTVLHNKDVMRMR